MKRATSYPWSLCVAVMTLPATALAAGGWDDEDLAGAYGNVQMVSIATGSAKPLDKAPAVASVVTAKEIRAMGATSLGQVLESIPGFHLYPSPINRMNESYSVRGIHTDQNAQLLILVDGSPISYAWNGSRADSFQLPVNAIARVEVVRGPGSALYGADAFAGVVNVITKTAAEVKQPEFGLAIGGWDQVQRYNTWYQQGGSQGDLHWMFSAEWLKSAADTNRQVNRDLQSNLDAAFGTKASLAPSYLDTRNNILNTHLNLQYQPFKVNLWYWRNDDAGVGAGAAQALDHQGANQVEQLQLQAEYQLPQWQQSWDNSLKFSYFRLWGETRFEIFPAGSTVLIGTDGNLFSAVGGAPKPVTFVDGVIGIPALDQQDTGLDWLSTYSGWQKLVLKWGMGLKEIRMDTQERKNFGPGVIDGSQAVVSGALTDVSGSRNIFMEPQRRRAHYALAQAEWQFMPDWELTLGARYDHYNDFGSTVNPRAALVWQTGQNLTTKLLYGSAFRAPSLDQLYAINNPVVLGNPKLKPETIDTYELAFDYRPSFELTALLNLYSYRAKDMIEFLPTTGGSMAANARDQQGYGLESELLWDPAPEHHWRLSFAWQHAQDVATHQFIVGAPRQHWLLSYRYEPVTHWAWSAQANAVMDRERAQTDTRPPVDDYVTVDTTLHFKPLADWEWQLAVTNLTDADVREPSSAAIPSDYPMSGRGFWLKTVVGF